MGGLTLLDRAKEIVRNKGVMTTLAIAPLAMSASVKADSVKFTLGSTYVSSGISGGAHGRIFFDLHDSGKTATLWGGSDIDGTHNYVTADAVAMNAGNVYYQWNGALCGEVKAGDVFNVMHDFSVALNSLNMDAQLCWSFTASAVTDHETATYKIDSDSEGLLGDFKGSGNQAFNCAGRGESWSAELRFYWKVGDLDGLAPGVDDNDRLVVDIPAASSIDLSIVPEAIPAPLPSPLLAVGSLLTMVGAVRLRKRGKRIAC